jgi:hypothetical protein
MSIRLIGSLGLLFQLPWSGLSRTVNNGKQSASMSPPQIHGVLHFNERSTSTTSFTTHLLTLTARAGLRTRHDVIQRD